MDIREQLAQTEDRLRELRQEKAQLAKVAEAAKKVAESSSDDQSYDAAKLAADAVKSVQARIDGAQADQVDMLREVGDAEAAGRVLGADLPTYRGGGASRSGNGYDEVAAKLDLANGVNRVDVAGSSLMRAQIPSAVASASVIAGRRRLRPRRSAVRTSPIRRSRVRARAPMPR